MPAWWSLLLIGLGGGLAGTLAWYLAWSFHAGWVLSLVIGAAATLGPGTVWILWILRKNPRIDAP